MEPNLPSDSCFADARQLFETDHFLEIQPQQENESTKTP